MRVTILSYDGENSRNGRAGMFDISKRIFVVVFITIILASSLLIFFQPQPEEEEQPGEEKVPWTFDPDWWKERHAWCFCPPLAGAESGYYYDVIDKTGVSAVDWLEIRWHEDWETVLRQIVDELHSRGIPVMSALSMLATWQEQREQPLELLEAVMRDPYGNVVEDNFGTPYTYRVYSTLHPTWQEYLLSCAKKTIDAGVDGFLLDEPTGTSYSPDFNDYTVQKFREYLLENYSDEELEEIGQKYGIENFENFDYADFVRDYLPAEMTQLTPEEWDRRWELRIPLYRDFDRFRYVKNREVMERLIQQLRAYARERYGREIPVMSNMGLQASEVIYLVDLVDSLSPEWPYAGFGYFPGARAFPILKLAEYFRKQVNLATAMTTDFDIAERGKEKTVNLYRTMIADAYGGGGAFHLMEGVHGIELDVEALAPYFHFVREKPLLFENLRPDKGDIGVLYLWEAIDVYQARAYRGLSNMLADSGYQFSVVFGADEAGGMWYDFADYPTPPYPLQLDNLLQYPIIIIPELPDVTETHADILLQYVENGGKLIVFATQDMLTQIEGEAGGPLHGPTSYDIFERVYEGKELERSENERVMQLLNYLRAGGASVGSGKIVRENQVWGREYLENLDPGLRLQLQQILSQENVEPEVKIPDNVRALSPFMYTGENRLVIHFVNYDYDLESDATNPVQPFELEVALGELPQEGLIVTFYSPEAPQGQELEVTVLNGTLHLTLPRIDIWGTLFVSA